MLAYAVKRILSALPIVLAISLFVFLLMHIAPGDPVTMMLGEGATQEDIDRARAEWGLDRPVLVQYGSFLANALTGDFGRSMFFGEPVAALLLERLPATMELTIVSLVVAVLIAIPVGVYSAVHQNSLGDHAGMTLALFGISMPNFWFGTLMIFLFAGRLQWLPASGRVPDSVSIEGFTGFVLLDTLLAGNWQGFLLGATHLILPALTLGTSLAGILTRLARSSVLEVVRNDYVRTARAKGLSERVVIWKHTVRNALIPVITVLGMQLGFLLGGSIVVETVFSWPGLGRLLIQAVSNRDYILVQGAVLILATWFVLINLAVDLTYGLVDPRIRYS